MNKTFFAVLALSLFTLPLASSAYAQCAPGTPCHPPTTTSSGIPSSEMSNPVPTVCFFTATSFKGKRFCETGMRSVYTVPAEWRDSIKSITVGDRTEVRVCPAFTLEGACGVIDRDIDELKPGLFDQVYSYDIDRT